MRSKLRCRKEGVSGRLVSFRRGIGIAHVIGKGCVRAGAKITPFRVRGRKDLPRRALRLFSFPADFRRASVATPPFSMFVSLVKKHKIVGFR